MRCIESIQENAYNLICQSFSAIRANSVATMLGISEDALAAGNERVKKTYCTP
jgi:hypothetical protein